ncbi:MAG: GTP-binding protein [Promethearchaeota archaeon]|nr:MAG: GTP-binding protein [Candidatus Lokiarchaeota archaeon]
MVKGVIYSQFNEKAGPEAIAWDPSNLHAEIRNLVSMKSINLLAGEGGIVPKSLAILPFPSQKLKGLIRALEIKDKTKRGGAIDSSLTLLFDESDDIIFYKYIDNFEKIFTEAATTIKKLYELDPTTPQINEELKKFHGVILETLNDLCSAEFACEEQEAFPSTDETEKKDLTTYRFKIAVVGDPGVGKTSTILRFTDKAFRRTYIPTVGVNISEKEIVIKDENIIIQFVLWDIAGQAKFQIMRRHFYSGADGQLLIFDLTRPPTFNNVKEWYQDIKNNLNKTIYGLICGNKSDLVDERLVEPAEISTLASELGLEGIETSAMTGKNVDNAFYKLGKLLITEKLKNS